MRDESKTAVFMTGLKVVVRDFLKDVKKILFRFSVLALFFTLLSVPFFLFDLLLHESPGKQLKVVLAGFGFWFTVALFWKFVEKCMATGRKEKGIKEQNNEQKICR